MEAKRIKEMTKLAVSHYWSTRASQRDRQRQHGRTDAGLRGAVTGGAQMDGFGMLFTELVLEQDLPPECVLTKTRLELPGFFRPTKEWDFLIVKNGTLVAAIEAKSQVGPSFGNNFNNRTEEAMGTALDIWTAFREGAFQNSPPPFVGYLFMLEDCSSSRNSVRVREPHFPVFEEFKGSSYMKRYELFYRKLVLERHYSATSFITSKPDTGLTGVYTTPAEDLSITRFCKSLSAHIGAVAER